MAKSGAGGGSAAKGPRRWPHVLGAVVAAVLILGLLALVSTQDGADDRATSPTPSASPSAVPSLGDPPAPAPSPSVIVTPTAPAVPSITVPALPTCLPVAPAPIRVVSFNIHGGRSHTTYDLGRIVEEIRALNADVVLLQEVHRFRRFSGFDDQPALLGERLGMTPVFGLTYTRNPEGPGRPRRESGNLILSRLPVIDSGNDLLPNQLGLEQRALLHVDVAVGDQTARIYDTHFQHTRGDIRIVQARAVRDLLRTAPGPFLLGGDLNTTADTAPVRILGAVAADPWLTIGPDAGLTVPARAPRRRIDYVMYGGVGWTPRQAQTFLSGVSDHRAVILDYELSPADPCGLS